MTRPATYSGGMYPLIGKPAHPELWDHCVVATTPSLGCTGLTVVDWSGYGLNGTLNGMDVSSDWATVDGRHVLDFDGTNDYISFPSTPMLSDIESITVSCFCSVSAASQLTVVSRYYQTTAENGWLLQGGTTSGFRFAGRESVAAFLSSGNSGSVVAGRLYHVCGRKWGNEWSIWVDGSLANSANVGTGTTLFAINPLKFARVDSPGTAYTACKIDDVRIYSRALSSKEIRLLASRRGIAHELAPVRKSRIFTGGFRAYWATRKAQIIGGGL